MKQQTTKFNGSLNYLAGVSSPSAANLTVQGLTDSDSAPKSEGKTTKRFRIPLSFLAGLSSPSAANLHTQGLSARNSLNFRF